MIPLSLYIHIPWCIRKCPYCDFNSHKSPEKIPEMQYINALIADLDNDLPYTAKQTITSIFIGGGTPSILSAKAYERLFELLKKRLTFAPDIEITLEANPGTVEQQRFAEYRAVGINRLSLGIQSFNASHLRTLGRIHDDRQAHHAIDSARNAGFDNLNLDLMHGLPGQSVKEGLTDLKTALSYQPEHLSWYQLTIEPNTVFYKKKPILPKEEDADELETLGLVKLAHDGYQRYEISAFCRENKACQHNLNYWLFGDYLGIGAGAHGKQTLKPNTIYRTRKLRQPNDYLDDKKVFCAARNLVSPEDALFEFMLNTTRLQQAIKHALFTERTGLAFSLLYPKLLLANKKGLIALNENEWQVTSRGRRFTNDLQALFLQDS